MSGKTRPAGRQVVRRAAALLVAVGLITGIQPTLVAPVRAADSPGAPAALADPNLQWKDASNALGGADDNSVATASGDNKDQGFRDFSFGIPAGSIIKGITVTANAWAPDTDCRLGVRLSGNGDANTNWTSWSYKNLSTVDSSILTFGSASDTWGAVWDPTQTTNGNFRLQVRNDAPSGCASTLITSLDWVRASVDYETITPRTKDNDPISKTVCDVADFNFVVDMSGSIGEQSGNPSNLPDLQAGINGFVVAFQGAGGDGKYSLTRFNDNSANTLTSGYVSPSDFQSAVDGLSSPSGWTPTSKGIDTGRTNNSGGRSGAQNIMFVLTDGSPNQPPVNPDTRIPAVWLGAANAAIASADAARSGYVVQAVYLATDGDPGDTSLPFSPAGDRQWATKVMDEIGGGSHLNADFANFALDLLDQIGCNPPQITIAKTAVESPVNAGDQIAFDISVTNSGEETADAVKIHDVLPGDDSLAWEVDSQACSIGKQVVDTKDRWVLDCTIDNLKVGKDNAKTVRVSTKTAPACGTYDNTASFTWKDQKGSADASVKVLCAAISITKEADNASVTAGDPIGFTITVKSTGDAPAKGVKVSDTLPADAGLDWAIDGGDDAASCSIASGTLTCDFDAMAPGASRNVHISSPTTRATLADSPVDNTAKVTTTNDGKDTSSDKVDILAGSIKIAKDPDKDVVDAGDPIGFTITVTSTGPGTARGAVLTDTLPTDAGTSWSVDGGTAAGTCSIDLGVLTCNLGDLPNEAVRTVHLTSGTSTATGADSPVHNVAKVTTTADGEAQDDADVVVLVGSLAWSKFDAHQHLLGGASFQVTGPSGFDETVEDNTGAPGYSGLDADETAGEFLLEDLMLGEYRVTETVAPAGYMLDETPQSAILTREQLDASIESPFVNTLGELSWTKDNGKGTPIGGATFSVEPDPFTGTGTLSVKDNDANDQDKTAGAFHLEDVRVGSYTVTETAAPEGYVLDEGSCSITVGEVSVDARLSSEVPACAFHNTPIPPAIAIIKTAGGSAGSQAADDTAYKAESFAGNVTYKYVVTNTGEVRLTGVWVVDDNGTPANTEDDWLPACYAGDLLLVQPFQLAAGASVTCYATMDITEDTTNVATASGTSVGEGTEVSANDDAAVRIVGPAVTIVKTAGGSAASQVADGETYATENGTDNVVYKYVVTNTGDTPLTITSLSDDKLGSISVEDCDTWSLPDKGDKATCTVSASISKDTENTASVKATSPAGAEVQATDKANVILRHVAIEKANDAEAPLLEGDNVHYTLTFDVQNGPITSMTVTDTLPAEVVNPRDFSVAPASVVGQVITWNLSNVADGATITYTATIADGTAAGSYTNVAEITDGPCVAGDCDDDSTVRVVTASISLVKTAGNAADGTTLRVDKPGNVIFTYVVKNTGTADLENLELIDDNATPANTTDDVKVTCPSTTLAAGASMTCTATLPVVVGSRTNIAVVTANPELDNETEVSDSDDAVVLVPEPVKPTPKPTPKVTPPPTSTIDGTDNGTTGTTGLLLVFAALAGLMLAVGYLNPARATARKRSRRG